MYKLLFVLLTLSVSGLSFLPSVLAAKPAPIPVKLIKVYKYQGSLQCQGGGEPLSVMRRQLVKARVKVLAGQCGVDGLMHPSVCGATDGQINIFTIARNDLAKSQVRGFDLLQNLPEAQITMCKP